MLEGCAVVLRRWDRDLGVWGVGLGFTVRGPAQDLGCGVHFRGLAASGLGDVELRIA